MSGASHGGWRLRWKDGWRDGPAAIIDGSTIRPDLLAYLPLAEMRGAKIQAGRREAPLGELFDIDPLPDGGSEARLVVGGSPRYVRIGAGMESGTLIVEGEGGEQLGAQMRGGTIFVRGSAGRLAGEGLRGGEIVIFGNAGSEIGLSMRRGLIAIAGSAGDLPGHHLLAGTILVAHGNLTLPGIEMRRGTIIGLESRGTPPPGFTPAGPVHLEWLRILRSRLESLAFPLTPAAAELLSATRPLECWNGDGLSLGRGEILQPGA